MKILIVSPDFPPPFEGGSLVYMYNITKCLNNINLQNQISPPLDITILTSPATPYPTNSPIELKTLSDHLHIIRTRFLSKSFDPTRTQLIIMYTFLTLYLIKTLLIKRYNVIFASAGVVGNSISTFIAHILETPSINFAYAEEITIPMSSTGAKNYFKKFLLKKIYPLATHTIAVCEFTKKILVNQLGIDESDVTVIPPLVDPQKITSVATKTTKNQIISVGRLVKRKGFDNLIKAFRLLVNEISDAKLIIVGRGPEESNIRRLIHKYQLHNNIILKGNLNDSNLAEEYNNSKCFVLANITLPNGDTEGCPTVILEAMAHGLPVIAGRDGGTSEAVIDGKTGYLIDVNDTKQLAEKIKIILTNKDIVDKFSIAGKIKIETEQTFAQTTEKILSLLHTLTKNQ